MKVLVTGATGTVGAHVVRELTERGLEPRAFVRDPVRAAERLGPAVELAIGDLADPSSLERALHGADALFLACGNVPEQVRLESDAIDAAAAAGVRRVVKLSGPHPAADSPVVYERWHARIEQHLLGSGLPWVLLRPRTYMSNLLANAATVAETGKLFASAATAAVSFIDPRDVASVAAVALAEAGHDGNAYTLTGPEAITFDRIAREFSTAIGRDVAYVDIPDAAARDAMLRAGLPEAAVEAVLSIFAVQRDGGMAGTTETVHQLTRREHAAAP
jgi:uncharacterized protein YbjT (DUF2867 family)